MFFRTKRIAGKEYAYLVENQWRAGRARQRVKKYLGPVLRPENVHHETFSAWKKVDLSSYIGNNSVRMIVRDLVQHALAMHDVKDVRIDPRGEVRRGKRKAVIALNDGYLCAETLQHLLNIRPHDEARRGEHLAEALLRAGIKADKETFVHLYRKLNNI